MPHLLLNIEGVVVDVFLVFHLPEEEGGLLLHIGEAGVLDVEVGELADFVGDFVDFLFDIVVHGEKV